MPELAFEILQRPDGYCAECLTERIFTNADTWHEVRKNILDATSAFLFLIGRGLTGFAFTVSAALERVGTLPQVSRMPSHGRFSPRLADEETWKTRFVKKRDIVHWIVREAPEEGAKGGRPPLSGLLGCGPASPRMSGVCFVIFRPTPNARQFSRRGQYLPGSHRPWLI